MPPARPAGGTHVRKHPGGVRRLSPIDGSNEARPRLGAAKTGGPSRGAERVDGAETSRRMGDFEQRTICVEPETQQIQSICDDQHECCIQYRITGRTDEERASQHYR